MTIVNAATAVTSDASRRLRLFNEKAAELQSYSFMTKAMHEDAGVTVRFETEMNLVETQRIGADKEATAAMILVLRLFLQPRDGIELHQIADLYQRLPVSGEDKESVRENLKELDSFLDRETELALNNRPITHRAVLETILHGDQAHVNEDRRIIFEAWRELRPIHMVLENFFEYAAVETIRYIQWLEAMNVEAIRALEATGTGS